jgi:hypothetical protein
MLMEGGDAVKDNVAMAMVTRRLRTFAVEEDHAALSNPLIVVAAFLEAGAADESWSC